MIRRDQDDLRLDPDLDREVSSTMRNPVRSAAIGFGGVLLIWAINYLSGGRPGPADYAAMALAFAVVDAIVLGTGWRHRLSTRRWAEARQIERNEERISIAAARTGSRRALIATIEEDIDHDEHG